ncbi:MAG TPA: hypothetical protein VGE40_05150, partial [Bacilli bacterium]
MHKIVVPLIVLALLAAILIPQQGLALTQSELDADELKEAEDIHTKAAQNIQEARSKIQSIQVQKNLTIKDVKSLEKEIVSLENEI